MLVDTHQAPPTGAPAIIGPAPFVSPPTILSADPVTSYAEACVDGDFAACKWERLACERHLRDLQDGALRGLVFDPGTARHAIEFYPSRLRHTKGKWAGTPIRLEGWQQFVVGSIFGWRRADGLRRFRDSLSEVPRKNGKTTTAGGLGLYLLTEDEEAGGEVYAAATKRDQAKLLFDPAVKMAKRSPRLKAQLRFPKTNEIRFPRLDGVFMPLGADANTLDGLNPSGTLVDELHAHRNRMVLTKLSEGMDAREQPLMFKITTAGESIVGVGFEEHEYACQVLEGAIEDDTYFAYITTIDEGDDWADEAAWAKANPNLGVSIHLDGMRARRTKALAKPADRTSFYIYRLNVWGESLDKGVDMGEWNAPANAAPFTDADILGRPWFGGLDLSSKLDLSAWSPVFPPEQPGGAWFQHCRLFMPEDNLAAAEIRDRVPYRAWVDDGWITATPGNVIDYEFIIAAIEADTKHYGRPVEIAFDSWNAAHMDARLQAMGHATVEVRQGTKSMGGPTAEFQALVAGGRWRHGGHPVLKWMAANLVMRQDANGNKMPDKRRSRARIDGPVSGIMAASRGLSNQAEERPALDFYTA